MAVETIKMSSKGQIVLPHTIRKEINATEGTVFSVISNKEAVILKKVKTPSKEELIKELEIIAKEGSKRAKRLGLKESDVSHLVSHARKSKL